jgi:hypothetical protein
MPRGGLEIQLYSFLTSALEGVGGQHHALTALPPGKTRYPLYRRLGGPQGRSGHVRKIFPPPGFFKCTLLCYLEHIYIQHTLVFTTISLSFRWYSLGMDDTSHLRTFRSSVCLWLDVGCVTYVDSRLTNIFHITLTTLPGCIRRVCGLNHCTWSFFVPYNVHILHWLRYIARDRDDTVRSPDRPARSQSLYRLSYYSPDLRTVPILFYL